MNLTQSENQRMVAEMARDFAEEAMNGACQLAKHRGSSAVAVNW